MVPPKAKRSKRRIVQSPEDEPERLEIDSGSPPKKRKLSTRKTGNSDRGPEVTNGVGSPSRLALSTRSPTKRPSPRKPTASSPEKPKAKSKIGGKPPSTRSIYTFFTSSTQQQRSAKGIKCPIPEEEQDDIIQDNSQDEGFIDGRDSNGTPGTGKARTELAAPLKDGAGRKFIMKGDTSRVNAPQDVPTATGDGPRPWPEKYAPVNLEELAVHKKKVSDVRTWLESVFGGRNRKRLLILKGPSGTGKTTTISLLSKDMDVDILEWRNPVCMEPLSEGFVSTSAQFEEFLRRGGKFGSLGLSNGVRNSGEDAASTPSRKKIILVEEFPNTFTRSSSALQSFRSALQNFLASNRPSHGTLFSNLATNEQTTPLVLIISETLLTTTTPSADSFTAHRLVGPDILNHPGVTLINFNPVAPTLLVKALELVIQKEARVTGRRKTPSRLVWDKLGEAGDVRSAISSLEFLCLRDDSGDWGSKVTFGKGRKRHKEVALTNMERESLELVTQREASLGIFHAVGKVVYNKRIDDNSPNAGSYPPPQPPDHLSQHARLRRSQVSVDELIDETGTDTQTFISALHENYVLSCGVLSSEVSLLDSMNGCIDSLSDSDLLCPNWGGGFGSGGMGGGFGQGTFQVVGADSLRQDEISFQIAVRGILFSLPYPVKRKLPPSSSGAVNWNKAGDAHKMFYPTALKLWRQTEEIKGNIDGWADRLVKGEVIITRRTPHAATEAKSGSGTIESWRSSFNGHSDANPAGHLPSDATTTAPTLLSGGSAAHREIILERLPYMAKIQIQDPTFLREIEKVTLFRGIAAQSDDIPDDEEEVPTVQWATDANEPESSPRKKKPTSREFDINGVVKGGLGFQIPAGKVDSLILSDDDIEDD